MEDKIKIEQRIDDYILGRMTSDERHRFEEDLKNDETLLKEYESQSLISRSVSAIHMKHIAAMAEESYQLALADTIDKYIIGDMSNEEKYAFEERNCERVTLDYFTGNLIASTLYQKVGFRNEGNMRHGGKKNGTYVDLHLMSMLRDEYFAQK